MVPVLLCWQMLWAFLQLSGDHHCFLWALLCLVLWSVLLITVCLRQKLPKLSLSLNFEMSCSNDGISSLFCMNGTGYGEVPGKKKLWFQSTFVLCFDRKKRKKRKERTLPSTFSSIQYETSLLLFSKLNNYRVLTLSSAGHTLLPSINNPSLPCSQCEL